MNHFNRLRSPAKGNPVAIVGMSCNLPGGSRSPELFWKHLLHKKCGITEIPEDRWNSDILYDPDPDAIAKSVSKWGGFIDDISGFDAKFFGISPREAQGMDPQQRMVLQGAVDAMYDSQIPLEEFSLKKTGVFIGVSQSEYRTLQEMRITHSEPFAGTGYALCITANRISHRLNLSGPSYAVDTACSSSLTALNQAVINLQIGACDLAIVGGVNAIAHPSSFVAFSKAGMVSPTGQISTFDESANGFVRGEGVGMIVAKTLDQAMADGDRVIAVIEATVANQDGATNTLTAPNQEAQIAMMRELFSCVDILPEHIGFVEAHGTGTPVGDPIEAGAIGTVIGQQCPKRPVNVGSCKANIGHLESGAGIAGLIKAAMTVHTGIVAPNINFKNPNPNIPFDALNLKVPVRPEPMPESDGTRYAVVNSFGFGGANACVLLSSPPSTRPGRRPYPQAKVSKSTQSENGFPQFFPISAASEEALSTNASALADQLSSKGRLADVPLEEIAATLGTRRSHLNHRAVILARTKRELLAALRHLAAGDHDKPNIVVGQSNPDRRICFTFSGQGSQWWAMARNLLLHHPTFAHVVDEFDAHFKPLTGWSIKDELLKDQQASRIDDTTVTQPALFAIQSGLAAVWQEFGIRPDMVVGHSIGEAAASFIAGGLSLSGAAKFLSKRGEIRDKVGRQGAMAAIGMHHEDVAPLLGDERRLGIAAINGPGSTTISGDFDAVHSFVEDFEMLRPDTFIRLLTVDTAWHSYHLDAGEDWFRKEMSSIDWSTPDIPFISTVTAKPETRFDTDYGWLNLRRPVNFQGGIEAAIALGANTFLELGPASTLEGPTQSTALETGANVEVRSSLSRNSSDFDKIAHTAACLFVGGIDLDWSQVSGEPSSHIELQGYVWAKEKFWQDSEESRKLLQQPVKHAFLGRRELLGLGTSWISDVNVKAYSYLKDHRLQADTLFPAAGYIDTIIAACREIFGPEKAIEVKDLTIHEALFIGPDSELMLNTIYDPERGRVKIYSKFRNTAEDWVLRCDALTRETDVSPPLPRKFDSRQKGLQKVDIGYVYHADSSSGYINWGETFRTIDQLWMTPSKTIAKIVLRDRDEGRSRANKYHAHPTMLDGCLQILEPSMTLKKLKIGRQASDPLCLPVGVGQIRVYSDFPDEIFVQAEQFKSSDDASSTVGFVVRDVEGNVLMTVEGARVSILPSKAATTDNKEVPAHFVRQELVEIHGENTDDLIIGNWLLLGNCTEFDNSLITELTALGSSVRSMSRSELGNEPGEALSDLIAHDIEAGNLTGIVVSWPLSLPKIEEGDETDVVCDPINACVRDLIALGDVLDYARSGELGIPDIVVLTSGAYPNLPGARADSSILTQMPITAVVRSLATETPEYRIRSIDVGAQYLADSSVPARYIMSCSAETELILHDDRCFGPRLLQSNPDDFNAKLRTVHQTDPVTNFHASMTSPGVIDNVDLFEIPMQPPGPGQVRVRVSAVGLNFRDIMAVTGLLPTEAEPEPAWQHLGLEFGAVVEELGSKVDVLKPGDRVMGLGRRCLQRFMTVDADTLTPLPDSVSLAQASTIPSAFATAHYALNHVGRMRQRDRVLIHVATGGVGTAAVKLAQAAGAEIFATAGTTEKRRLLKHLGVQHVMDSRSLKFADDVMRITKGRGVDILLNSLPGNYIAKGLEIMAPYGRFLEIGKRDVYEDTSIGMKALRSNVSMSVIDLASMGSDRPDLLAQVLREIGEIFTDPSELSLPYTKFPISQVSEAIRFMSQAKHIGKVVVTLDEDKFHVRRDVDQPIRLSNSGSYLITGGTGGFSLSIADWLSNAGAGRLVLASRSGQTDAAGQRFVEKLRTRGTEVSIIALDVSNAEAVDTYVRDSQANDKPLKGVIHGAAVIKDGLANQLTPEMIIDVLSPKVRGGWNLHKAFAKAGIEPDFLIGFSSISQIIGSAGQCNYVAGNAFLDALAYYRVSLGRPGVAIDWGAISDAGFVARNAALASYLESVGLYGLRRNEFPAAMELSVARNAPSFIYSRADWDKITRANPALGESPRMATVLATDGGATQEVRSRLMQLQGDALVDATRQFIKDEMANVLKVDTATIQIERPMNELGLDSLSSFELKIRIETALDFNLPVSKFLQAPTVAELSRVLADEFDAIRQAEETALERESQSTDPSQIVVDSDRPKASNRQIGLFRLSVAPMTSEHTKRAMEFSARSVLPKDSDPDVVNKSLAGLARRHPMLRMGIDTDGYLMLDAPAPQLCETRSGGVLNTAQGEFLRVFIDHDSKMKQINVQMHAVMGDQASCNLLIDELLSRIEGHELGRTLPKAAVLKAIADCVYDPESAVSINDRAFWWYSLAPGAKPVPFRQRSRPMLAVSAGADHGVAHYLEGELGSPARESLVLIAFATALRTVSKSQGQVIIDRKSSLRSRLKSQVAIGPFEIEQPLRVSVDAGHVVDHAALERTLKNADLHRSFDSQVASVELAADFEDWGVLPSQFLFEPQAQLDAKPPSATRHDIWLQVNVTEPALRARLIYDGDVVDEELAKKTIKTMRTLLKTPATADSM